MAETLDLEIELQNVVTSAALEQRFNLLDIQKTFRGVEYNARALRCEFRDPESISGKVKNLIESEDLKDRYEKRAYEYTRDKIWPNVAMKYINEVYKTLGM